MRAVRDTLIASPPLVISDEEIDLLVQQTWKTLDQTMADVKGEMA